MRKANYLLLLLIVVLLVAASCVKKGAVGPQEPMSSTGPTGTIGTATYSAWYTPTSYNRDTTSGTYQFYTNIPALNITPDTLKNDTVLVYSKLDGYNPILFPSNVVSPMPVIVTYVEGSTEYTDTWSASIAPGNIRINFADDRNSSTGLYYAHKFRYVILPVGVHTMVHINIKNYAEVKKALHLPD